MINFVKQQTLPGVVMSYRVSLAAVVAVITHVLGATCNTDCKPRAYEVPGDVTFTVILSASGSDRQGGCGEVSYGALQTILALNYSIEKLNQPDTFGKQFIPGVKVGYKLLDDCGNPEIASAHAYDILSSSFPKSIMNCAEEESYFAGVLGASRSPTTAAVATILKSTELPVVTFGATLADFSNKTLYPNLLRTVLSDVDQMKAIIALVTKIEWKRFVLIHTDDNYGESGASQIQQLAKQKNICVSMVTAIPMNKYSDVNKIFLDLRQQAPSYGDKMGVVYVGQVEVASYILKEASRLLTTSSHHRDYQFIRAITWIMSDSVGTNSVVLTDNSYISDGVLTISPAYTQLTEFSQFFRDEMSLAVRNQGSTNPWVTKFVRQMCNPDFPQDGCTNFQQNDYINTALDAIYAIISAVGDAHREHCPDQVGICQSLKSSGKILEKLKGIDLNYALHNSVNVPPVFIRSKRRVQFDRNGDISCRSQTPCYNINMFWNNSFHKVGYYSQDGMQLDALRLRQRDINGDVRLPPNLLPSSCPLTCEECVQEPPFVYIDGEAILLAILSMHDAPTGDPFKCGELLLSTSAIPTLHALLHHFQTELRSYEGQSFGLIVFDDCYNSLRANEILSNVFSGKTVLTDERTGRRIETDRIVAVIGPQSSGVCVPAAQSLTKLGLPHVAFSASSPDLDDRSVFPYFLRTVPSDTVQADLMVQIVKSMDWNYFDIIYTNNNYGFKGMKKIVESARAKRICHGDPYPIREVPDEKTLHEIIGSLSRKNAKVVIFFGTGTSIRKLLQTMNGLGVQPFTFIASEDLGVNKALIRGVERQAVGSITITLDPSLVVKNSLRDHLKRYVPHESHLVPWFAMYWQYIFQCNLPWAHTKTESLPTCKENLTLRDTVLEYMTRGQRPVHVMNAISAVVKGLVSAQKKLCSFDSSGVFACDTFRQEPELVASHIRNVILSDGRDEFTPFRKDGNGNIGFLVHNLQRMPDNSYEYIEVGEFNSNGLQLVTEKIKFYDGQKTRREISTISSICAVNCSQCSGGTSAVSTERPGPQKTEMIAILVLTSLVFIMVAVQLVLLVVRKNTKDRKSCIAQPPAVMAGSQFPRSYVVENPSTIYSCRSPGDTESSGSSNPSPSVQNTNIPANDSSNRANDLTNCINDLTFAVSDQTHTIQRPDFENSKPCPNCQTEYIL